MKDITAWTGRSDEERTLEGQVAVVCGGSRGLGRAMARELARQGARVAICARSWDALNEARIELEALGAWVLADACDLRDEEQTRVFLEHVVSTLGPIDVLVANAATISVGPIEATTPDDFDDAMSSIFGTAVRAALGALPGMQARRAGTIAFIASIGGKFGVPHLAPYSAAKFGVIGFAEALRAEVRKDGIRVLTVVPGLMRTGSHLHASFHGDAQKEFGWFAAGAVTPVVAIDADRAARQVVRAIARGDEALTLTPAARIASRLHDLAPALWQRCTSVMARLLPSAPDLGERATEGKQLMGASGVLARFVRALTPPLATRFGQ